jgi:hypothetical protein
VFDRDVDIFFVAERNIDDFFFIGRVKQFEGFPRDRSDKLIQRGQQSTSLLMKCLVSIYEGF